MNFDFLKSVEVQAPEKATTTRITADKTPEGMALRVFSTGKVYPSKELVAKYNLEYANKDAENPGNGFDFFKSSDWAGFPVDAPETYIFFAAVPKTSSKVSIFGSCGYGEKDTPEANIPTSSVLTQGGGKAGKELLTLVQEVFGITVEKGSYVDVVINEEIAIPSNTGVYYFPKNTKKKDGTIVPDAVRRENVVVNPISVLNMGEFDVTPEDTAEAVAAPVNPFATPANDLIADASPEMPPMPETDIPTV